MKKLAIVGASAALAAMPVLGVFAETPQPVTQTDTIQITVKDSCELAVEGNGNQTYKADMTVGSFNDNIPGSEFKVACNTGNQWELNAVGASDGGTVNALHGATNGNITSSETPGTNLKKDATSSDWGFKLSNDSTDASIQSGFEDWSQIPTTSKKVATGEKVTGEDKVKVTYGVTIGNQQKADTYTGKVTFTLSQPAA